MNRSLQMRWPALIALSVVTLVLAGCASQPAPVEELAVASAAIERADSRSTREHASGELQVAKTKLASAREARERGDQERARQLAVQAEIDAEVAMLHAQATRSRRSAEEVERAAEVLREELDRQTTR